MVWGELHPDDPAIVGIEDTVEVVVGQHSTVEHSGPKGALSTKIAGIEDHNSSHDSHVVMLPERGCPVALDARSGARVHGRAQAEMRPAPLRDGASR